MSHMVAYARISQDNENYVRFNPGALAPLDGLKVLLEQVLYASYLRDVVRYKTAEDIMRTVIQYFPSLPRTINPFTYGPTANLYEEGVHYLSRAIHENDPELLVLDAQCRRLLEGLFLIDSNARYVDGEYTATMNATFLKEYAAFKTNGESAPSDESEIVNACLFVPRLVPVLNRDPALARVENHDWQIVLNLEPHAMRSFDLSTTPYPEGVRSGLYGFLRRFDMSDLKGVDLIPILSSFALDHNQYGMTNVRDYRGISVQDVCFDLVTGSAYTAPSAGLNGACNDFQDFIECLKYLHDNKRLGELGDYALFGELVQRCGQDPQICNYFTKPIAEVLASEAYAFRNSVYAEFIDDRFQASMEAIGDDDTTTTDTPEEGLEPTDDGETKPQEPVTEDSLNEGPDPEDTSINDQTQDIHKPTIDPKLMLLEMASPDESLSDYIFRETVSLRIDNFLRNPPENASPNDLLMLKRWRSSWLWLTSISCLRDFLTRLKLRLSNP